MCVLSEVDVAIITVCVCQKMAAGEEFGKSEVFVTHSTLHVAGFIQGCSRRHRHVLCGVVTD